MAVASIQLVASVDLHAEDTTAGARALWADAVSHIVSDYYELGPSGKRIKFSEEQVAQRLTELLNESVRAKGGTIGVPPDFSDLEHLQIEKNFFDFLNQLHILHRGRKSATELVEYSLNLLCNNDLRYSQYWSKPYQRKRLELEDNPLLNARFDFSVRREDDHSFLCFPFDKGDAWTQGMRARDRLESFDGIPAGQISMQDLFLRFFGQADTSAKIKVRQKSGRVLNLDLSRRHVTRSVTAHPYRDSQIFVIPEISNDSVKQLAILLRKSPSPNIILDLRGNGGGPLPPVSDLVGLFVPGPRPIVVGRTYQDDKLESELTSNAQCVEGIERINLIVDGGSASTAELFVLALKEALGEQVVVSGSKTYGKDVWTGLISFPGGGALMIPMGPIRTASGNGWRDGISPTFSHP